jgi:hypothetical protein
MMWMAVLPSVVIVALVVVYGYRKAVNIPRADRTRLDMLRDLGIS